MVRPGEDLLAELGRAGLPGASEDGIAAAVERSLAADPECRRLLLVVDQFEELLLHGEQRGVLEQLETVADSRLALSVVLVMRDDFYPRLVEVAGNLLEGVVVNVPAALGMRDLRDIIDRPAEAVGLRFAEGLAELITADLLVGSTARQMPVTLLPALQLTLRQLWEEREDGILTREAYRRMGVSRGAWRRGAAASSTGCPRRTGR